MNRLTEFAVARRSVILLLAAALFLTGIYSWANLQQELLPDIQLPVITVIAPYPGASANDVAEQVTKPIERAISNVPRLENLQSTSANSVSVVVAQFSYGTDVKETKTAIDNGIAGLGLPQGVTPQVSALDINQTPVIIASVSASGPGGLATAARVARDDIVPALQGLDGVASVDVTGGEEQRAVITLDPVKLAASGISYQQIAGVLQANNLTLPSGQLAQGDANIPVSASSAFGSLGQIKNLIVGAKTTGGSPKPVTIGNLGTVKVVGVPTTGYARVDGDPAITLTVSKASGANTVTVADEVTAQLEAAQSRDPGVRIGVVSDLSGFIKESRDGLLREGGLGAVFAILTILLFLGSLRSTLVAAVSIPLSIMAALTLMLVTGISMNIMTLGGLAVAIGRVVDDAIVVLENIYRHRARGEERSTAVLSGAREVSGAITASTATTVMVFLPLGFVGGLVSQFFLPFALTVTFALLASLLCALTVVPVLAYFLVDRVKADVDETGEPRHSIWVRLYTPTIRLALRNRWTKWGIVGVAGGLFVASFALLPSIPTQFINAGGEKVLEVSIAPPPGTGSQVVLARSIEAEKILDAHRPPVEQVATSVPGEADTGLQSLTAAFSGRPSNSATLRVKLAASTDLKSYAKQLTDLLKPIAGDGWDVTVSEATGFSSGGINVVVSSSDPARLAAVNTAVVGALKSNPDLINVKSNLSTGTPVVAVDVDPNKAVGAGMTTAQVAGAVRQVLVPNKVSRLQPDGQPPLDLYLQIDPAAVDSVDALARIPVGTVRTVPLGAIASVQQADAQGSITRIDQQPAASISAEITSEDTGAVSRAVQKEIDALTAAGTIPAGVTVTLAGVTQQQNSAFSGLFVSMGVAVLLVYVMLVLTFNSLVTPFIILFSLPLATIGAFIALYVTGRPIGISALIGFLMLIGIVVTNAIVLLDLVERLRAGGESTTEALVEGGRTRVRPILMTAIATMLALIPLAAGFNEGSIIAAELGTVVIGGLFSSTFLTLIVVPVVYSLVDGGKTGVANRVGRRAAEAEAEAPAGAAVDGA